MKRITENWQKVLARLDFKLKKRQGINDFLILSDLKKELSILLGFDDDEYLVALCPLSSSLNMGYQQIVLSTHSIYVRDDINDLTPIKIDICAITNIEFIDHFKRDVRSPKRLKISFDNNSLNIVFSNSAEVTGVVSLIYAIIRYTTV